MAGIKAKISTTIDKLTHKSNTNESPSGYGSNTTGTTSNTGLGNTGELNKTSDYNTTSGTTGSEYGTTGAGYGTTGTGTGTETGYETGRTGGLETGTTGAGYGTTTGTVGGTGEIIDSETFTKTEDHEVLIEKKRYELEHRPVQKQYVVETRYVGEKAVAGGPTEVVGHETREVEEHVHQAPAGDRTIVVENVDVPAGTRTTGTTGATGSTY
jgi:hypothetical protein